MSAHEDDRKVRVCIRVRPPLASEPQDTSCLSVEPETATVALHKASAMTEKFKVDRVFGTDASTPQLYDTEIAPLVSRALERGANATVFAYGVTGSKSVVMSFPPQRPLCRKGVANRQAPAACLQGLGTGRAS